MSRNKALLIVNSCKFLIERTFMYDRGLTLVQLLVRGMVQDPRIFQKGPAISLAKGLLHQGLPGLGKGWKTGQSSLYGKLNNSLGHL